MSTGVPSSLKAWCAAGFVAGVVAGVAAGTIDALWSWGETSQYLSTAGKVRFTIYLATSYGLASAVLGTSLAAFAGCLTKIPWLRSVLQTAASTHSDKRARTPEETLIGLALAVTIPLCLWSAWAFTYLNSLPYLLSRKHLPLAFATSMVSVLAATAVGLLAAMILAYPVERGFRRLVRKRPRLAQLLSSLWAPPIVIAAMFAAAIAVVVSISWDTLSLLRLRPSSIGLVTFLLFVPLLSRRLIANHKKATSGLATRKLVLAFVSVALLAIALVFGGSETVQKAADSYSGLGSAIARMIRNVGDWDRDGYSRLLAGGDCDDWSADVYPGRDDIPDDGIDNNCIGGDAKTSHPPNNPEFGSTPQWTRLPNVLLITIDTLRADHLGAYGYSRATSPHLDQLARSGTLFTNAWAHAPSTRYSIPAILTGRYPLSVRYQPIPNQWPGLALENSTIAEIAKEQGLTTGAILNYWYFDRIRNINQGFDHYDNSNKRLHRAAGKEGPKKTLGSSSRSQTDKAISFVTGHSDKPFFLWVHYYDPHYEYEVHSGSPRFGSNDIDRYDNEIHHTDAQIGRLLAHLQRSGLDSNTVVIATGDHGEGFGEHGINFHGYELYAAQTRVPLILRIPNVDVGTVTTPVGHVDILPTVANLLGASPSPTMMGRSLLPLADGTGDTEDDRWIFQQLSFENNNEHRGAASRDCHVIYHISPTTSWELYRLDRDPEELVDAIDDPGPCEDGRHALGSWVDNVEIPHGAHDALIDQLPQLAAPLGVLLGEDVELVGVEMAEAARRGSTVTMTYYWRARGTPTKGWRVFAHFEGDRDRFSGDHRPQRPFSWWRKGQHLRTESQLLIPRSTKPGRYQLWTGLYKQDRRAKARGNAQIRDNRVLAATIEVTR